MSDLPVPRETRAGCVTARRPPCQRAGLETDPAPGGSPCVASDAQVRPAAGLQGTRRLAAAAELGRVAGSSPGAVLPGVAAGPLSSAPSRFSCFPRFSAGTRLSRVAPISPRALPSPGTLQLLLRVGVSLFGGSSPVPASLRVAFICPQIPSFPSTATSSVVRNRLVPPFFSSLWAEIYLFFLVCMFARLKFKAEKNNI